MCLGCSSKRNKTVTKGGGCIHLYNELTLLDLRVLEIFKETKNPKLLLVNTQLRQWIKNIKVNCPPEDEFKLIKEIINQHEYPID